VALVASLGLLRPQILSLEAVLFKGGRSSGYVGNHYGWCLGSKVDSPMRGNSTDFNNLGTPSDNTNGIVNFYTTRRLKDVTDGLSKTILASEFLTGKGLSGAGTGTYPFDLFSIGWSNWDYGDFPPVSVLNTLGSTTPTSSDGRNGRY